MKNNHYPLAIIILLFTCFIAWRMSVVQDNLKKLSHDIAVNRDLDEMELSK